MTAGGDSLIRFWKSSDGTNVSEYDLRVGSCANAQFFPDGDHILYSQRGSVVDTTVKWNWRERRRVWAIPAHYTVVSPDGEIVVAAIDSGGEKQLWLVDPTTGRLSRPFGSYDPHALISMRISPDHRRLLYAEPTGASKLYDLETGNAIGVFNFGNPTYTVRFANDQKLVVVSSIIPRVFNPVTGDTLLTLEQSLGRTYDASYSPDGKYIATLSIDWGVRLWDGTTGKLVKLLGRQSSIGYSLEFSSDGKHIVTTSVDGKAFVWIVPEAPSGVTDQDNSVARGYNARLYPNPATSEARIEYSVPHAAAVHIRLVDSRGTVVASLPGTMREPGEYQERLDLRELPSGMYLCEIRVGISRIARSVHIER